MAIKGRQRSGLNIVPPKCRALRADTPPTIDGDLSDACWQNAQELTPFVDLNKDEPARLKTVARICYDDRALYFAVHAEEPDMEAVKDTLAKVDHGTWGCRSRRMCRATEPSAGLGSRRLRRFE